MAYKIVIVGSGPAGLTAGIYASRAKIDTLVIEGPLPGGQLTTTTKVENWPGNISIEGPDLMLSIRKQAEVCGCSFLSGTIKKVDFETYPFKLFTDQEKIVEAESVIIATGASPKKLGCPGEEEYWARGVSACATCDAPFYEGKEVVVVGGGDSAVTEADHLAHFAKKVTIVHILDKLTSTDPIKDRVLSNPKIEILYNTTVSQIKGDVQKVKEVVLNNQKDESSSTKSVDGVFIAIGMNPNSSFVQNQLELDEHGYVVVHDHTKTSVDGVFAAGDVEDFRYRQAITAAGAGCMAALDCQSYLKTRNS
jgi:thioredoxin reductase (NADPH)